jgi:hypothetical protein
MPRAEFAFVQARLQSRLGDALRANWPAIEASRSVAQYLAAVRTGALAWWVEGLDESRDAHRLERVLHERWVIYVASIVRWQPGAWRAATQWFGMLPALARIDATRKQGKAGANAEVPAIFAVPYETTGARSTASLWRTEFERRTPPGNSRGATFMQPAQWLLPIFAGDHAGRRAVPERARAALVRLLRRFAASPVAVFAFLALVALDVERLRGGLLVRQLMVRAPRAEAA